MRLFICIAFLYLFAHAGEQAANSQFPYESLKSELSAQDRHYIEKLPDQVIFDWVQVPESHQIKDGETLRVFYEYRLPKKTDKNKRPICFFYGGPGLDPRSAVHSLLPMTKENGILIIHQRGTGLSSPLPKIQHDSDILRYKNYLSRAIVQDAEIIRKKIFDHQAWVVTGQSFGSLIIQRYITMYPNSLYSAHAHGFAATSLPTPFAEARIIKHKEVLNEYLKKYPKDKKRLELIAQYCKTNTFSPKNEPQIKIQGRHSFSFAGMVFLSAPNYWKDLSNILTMICPENTVDPHKLKLMINNFYFNKSFLHLGKEQDVLNVVFNRHEAYVTQVGQSLSNYYKEIITKLKKQDIDTDKWSMGEEALMHFCIDAPMHNLADSYDLGPADPLRPKDIAKALKNTPHLNFHLYAGEIDSVAPPETFEELQKHCHRGLSFKILPGGHDSFLSPVFWEEVFKHSQE
ncbi:putative prolyl aminopeptidase [Lentisphaera araneosa HTCC2155]|uniref:Putative prolyl aminopeptidase n=1 Tax=Lentisphaera araneosa HTCC2155 TaxID=313628 RepID=A6DGX2_9BACT|nr:alpha/beta fold hydrolase [Lentisphaera araneosa]EDM28855.1 putative prolyl aminopeptidase [Lentisphaera araneosa HTCC2155]